MKKLMLGLMMAFAATAEAVILKEYTLSDTLTATFDDQRMLTISGSGPMPDWGADEDQVWSQERLQIRSVVGEGVTSVGMYAFNGCGNLTSVSFPNATTVGAHAFRSCINLTSVSFPNATTVGKSAFMGCRWLTSVSFPNPNATTVGMSAFGNCLELTSVTLPNATTIGEGAFTGCISIETVVLSLDLAANPDRTGWGLRDQAKLIGLGTKEDVENAKVEDVVWTIGEAQVKSKAYETACAYYGITPKSVQAIGGDDIVVKKESIQAAKAETISIANNEIQLGVSVLSNANITAEIAEWGKVKFDENTKVGLSEDGTQLIISIPVAAQQGFMILQSGDAKAAPSNGAKQGFYKLEAR